MSAPKQEHRRKTFINRFALGACGLVLVLSGGLAGVGCSLAATLPPVTAIPVTLIAQNSLSRQACEAGSSLQVTFPWHDSPTVRTYYPACNRSYTAGEQIHAHVDSSDPGDIGPTAEWILQPDERDPFAFVDPNALPLFLGLAAFVLAASGLIAVIFAAVARLWSRGEFDKSPLVSR